MLDNDGVIRTTDLTLATVLIINGYHPVMELLSSKKVRWVLEFEDVDEYSVEILDDYKRGACRVEPKRFCRELRAVRQEMYKFLGIGDRPRGVPITSPATE